MHSPLCLATFCSGVGTAELVAQELGWSSVFCSEIAPHPSAVLQHRYPNTPNIGDMRAIDGSKYRGSIDVAIAGTSCQGFSVSGLGKGLDDPRSALAIRFIELLAAIRPRWFEWENVPGIFSCNDRADFAAFLGCLTGRAIAPPARWCNGGVIQGIKGAYSVAWRVFDAQYFGVPQRRRRVFVVGHLGDWRAPYAVLFEPDCLPGHSQPSPSQRQSNTCGTGDGIGGNSESKTVANFQQNQRGEVRLTGGDGQTVGAIAVHPGISQQNLLCFSSHGMANDIGMSIAPTMRSSGGCPPAIAYSLSWDSPSAKDGYKNWQLSTELSHTFCANSAKQALLTYPIIRRLTPIEVERLFGFPDNYTQVPYKGQPMKDGSRYRMLGNAIAYPVLLWISRRLQRVHELITVPF